MPRKCKLVDTTSKKVSSGEYLITFKTSVYEGVEILRFRLFCPDTMRLVYKSASFDRGHIVEVAADGNSEEFLITTMGGTRHYIQIWV